MRVRVSDRTVRHLIGTGYLALGRDERAQEATDGTKSPTIQTVGTKPRVTSKLGRSAPAGSKTRPTKPDWWAGLTSGGPQRE